MNIFNIISLCGGLAFFLYGMHIMSSGLNKLTGGKLELTLKKMTSNPLNSLLLGAGITIAIQSSSAMTVMLVGLVNSGVMQLSQTVGVIMIMGSSKPRRRDLGVILVGFAILMYGMELMTDSVSPLADMPQFSSILTAFSNPILGVAVGAIFTGIIQSSAASVGILQALSLTGAVTFGTAIPIIMGQNIGTCVTAIISSVGVNRNAKRVAAVHISFNIIGTIVFLILYFICDMIIGLPFIDDAITPSGIALCHSVFNIATTAMLLPFRNQLVTLACRLVPDKPGEKQAVDLMPDERLLVTPGFAVAECNDRVNDMANLAASAVNSSIDLFLNYDEKLDEDMLDKYEDALGTFLVKVSCETLSAEDSRQVSKCLHTISDLERIGDHAQNIAEVAQEMHDKRIEFSGDADKDLDVINSAVREVVSITTKAFTTSDLELAKQVEPLEDVIDELIDEAKSRHIARLQHSECTIELGFIFTDYLTNIERISDHCSNVAVCLLEVAGTEFDTHNYIYNMKDLPEFKQLFAQYRDKYQLP